MLKLAGTDGKRYYSLPLKKGKWIVGRQPDCDLSIPHKTVSRNHAEVEVVSDDGQFYLTDLGSRNGTLINGEIISKRTSIKKGDIISFGNSEFRIEPDRGGENAAPDMTMVKFSDHEPQNSVLMPIDEALKPLPTSLTGKPEVLSTVSEMAKMPVFAEPKEMMLEKGLGIIAKVIPAERYAVLFISEENNEEVRTVASLIPGKSQPGDFEISQTIFNQIMTEKTLFMLSDPLDDPRFAQQQSIVMAKLRSAMAVPLFDEGRVLGILYVDTSSPVHLYGDDHLRLLGTFGNIIASKLLNYELMAEREQKQILDAELDRASSIQKNLLINDPPIIEGFQLCTFQEQSRSVGGDLYDVTVLPDGRMLFVLADVSGKGMGAALLMSNILASFRILYDAPDFNLTRVVERVSGQLYKHSDPGDFATLFIGLLEPDKNRIRYINAGHNPPLMTRSDGDIEHLMDTGMVIGVVDFAAWEEKTVSFDDGDLLFIYTDGVTEAQHPDESEQFGEERLEKIVTAERENSPKAVVGCLMKEINGFMGDAPRSDDITIMAIKKARNDV